MIIIEASSFKVYIFKRTQIFSVTAKIVILFKAYNKFEDIFFVKNDNNLSSHEDHNHLIYLINSKQCSYKLTYGLSENELSISQVYINNILVNRFIRPSKFLFDELILFVPKPSGDLLLSVEYRGLNNITIKNRYNYKRG